MNLRQRWIEALRSGKYRQMKGGLRKGASFCCLGVLCDIRDPTGWEAHPHAYDKSRYLGTLFLPPTEVRLEVAISYGYANLLAQLNDNGKSFAEIADKLEEDFASGGQSDERTRIP